MLLDLPPHEIVDLEESLVRLRGGQEALQRGEERRDGEGRRGEALEHDVQNLDGLLRYRIKPTWKSILVSHLGLNDFIHSTSPGSI